MADEIIIETSAPEVIEVGVPGPQGPQGQGVPVGGTAGQVLRKASGTNYDTEWATGGGGGVSSWNDLTDKPATFPPSSHTHPISEVTNLQTSLDGKAATSHTHTASQVTDFNTAAAAAAPVQSVAGRTGAITLAVADVSGAVSTSDSRLSDERPDNTFRIVGSSDATKKVAFEVDGITTGTVRTLSVADASGTLGWLQSVSSITVSSTHQLTAARNQRVLVNNTASVGNSVAIFYPTSGNAEGDRLEIVHASQTNGTQAISVRAGQFDFTGSQSIRLGYQRTFIYVSGSWTTAGSVEEHTHPDPDPTFASSAFRVTEPSGLATNQLAFSLANITAGATRTLGVPNASGTIALQGAITTSGLTQATARILGRTTASTGAVEEIQIGAGLSLSAGQLSATASGATTQTDVFTSSGTWTKPAGAKMVHYILIGGGGGGGSGRRSDASTAAFGGGGGGGAGVSIGWLNADFLGSTETVTVGAGGSGGAARTASDNNGANGAPGSNSSFGSFLEARGGLLGSGGTTTTGTRGSPTPARGAFYGGSQDSSAGGGGGSADATGGTGENRMSMPSGGGGGAGKSAAGAYGTGGASAAIGLIGTGQRTGIAATANAAGTAGTGFFYYGVGGSGGSANSATGAANKGGDGGLYGAGGGGGSGSLNAAGGDNSGGAGAQGVAIITTYF
jgi:hypothetical protein